MSSSEFQVLLGKKWLLINIFPMANAMTISKISTCGHCCLIVFIVLGLANQHWTKWVTTYFTFLILMYVSKKKPPGRKNSVSPWRFDALPRLVVTTSVPRATKLNISWYHHLQEFLLPFYLFFRPFSCKKVKQVTFVTK